MFPAGRSGSSSASSELPYPISTRQELFFRGTNPNSGFQCFTSPSVHWLSVFRRKEETLGPLLHKRYRWATSATGVSKPLSLSCLKLTGKVGVDQCSSLLGCRSLYRKEKTGARRRELVLQMAVSALSLPAIAASGCALADEGIVSLVLNILSKFWVSISESHGCWVSRVCRGFQALC